MAPLLDPITIAIILGAAAAGFVQGLSGFAFAMVSSAIWVWVLPPQISSPLVVFGSLVGQILAIPATRKGFSARRAAPLVIGGLLGVPIGVAILPHVEPAWFKAGLGLLLVVYCPAMLFSTRLPHLRVSGPTGDGAVGFLGGVLGGIGGITGVLPTLWCTLNGWDKLTQRSVLQAFNLTMHATTLTLYLVAGRITWTSAAMFPIVLPAMLVPTLIGLRLYARISEMAFRRVVLGLLFLTGIALLVAAAPVLVAKLSG